MRPSKGLLIVLCAGLGMAWRVVAQPLVASAAAVRAGVSVRGTVRDSLHGGAPLVGAEVLLDGLDATATTDWRGRFRIADVPIGRYRATFDHASLDSLSLAGPTRIVDVGGGEELEISLHVPSAASLYRATCGPGVPGHGVVAGTVVRTDGGPPHNAAEVRVRWRRLVIADRVRAEPMELVARTDAYGRYRLCHVPIDAPLRLGASADDGSVLTRELVLGDAPCALLPPITLQGRIGGGDGASLSVRVVDAASRLMAGAQLFIAGARAGISDADGRVLVPDLLVGDHQLEVRAIGYRAVQGTVSTRQNSRTLAVVMLGAPVVTLATRTVTASRDPTGFQLRAASGSGGTFLDEKQIADRRATRTSDLFMGIPGVDVTPHGRSNIITMGRAVGSRGAFQQRWYFVWYVDGVLFFDPTRFPQTNDSLGSQERDGLRPDMLDQVATPQDLAGIEVYTSVTSAPPLYATIGGECGVILVWTRRGQALPG